MSGGDDYQELRAIVRKWREHENCVTDLSDLSPKLKAQWANAAYRGNNFEALGNRIEEFLSSDEYNPALATVSESG